MTSAMLRASLDRAPVVVAVDGSADSPEAAAWAAERASEWGAPLHLIAAVPAASASGSVPSWLGVSRVAAWRAGLDPDVTETARGDLLQVLAVRAAHARLVIIPGTVPGPVSAALADRVDCPVVVCRDGYAPSVVATAKPGDGGRATREAVATGSPA